MPKNRSEVQNAVETFLAWGHLCSHFILTFLKCFDCFSRQSSRSTMSRNPKIKKPSTKTKEPMEFFFEKKNRTSLDWKKISLEDLVVSRNALSMETRLELRTAKPIPSNIRPLSTLISIENFVHFRKETKRSLIFLTLSTQLSFKRLFRSIKVYNIVKKLCFRLIFYLLWSSLSLKLILIAKNCLK